VFWIERTYNRRRRQRALGKLTPVECELAFTTTPPPTWQHDQSPTTVK
jgi:transposase InsO family protein